MENNKVTKKKSFKSVDKHFIWLLALLVGMFVVASLINTRGFLTLRNFQSMSVQFPEYGIMAFGMMICMIAGGIDLSVVGVANLTGIIAAWIMTQFEVANAGVIALAIAAAAIVAVLCGMFNGFLIGYLKIPAMLVTLCGLEVYSGLGLAITKGPAITGLPESYQAIGNGYLFKVVPIPLVIFIVVVAILWFIIKYTKYGQQVYMVGANPTASRYSGINNLKVLMTTHVISAVLAMISGIIITAHYGSGKSDYGSSYTLLTLLIIILGGINPSGGKGKIGGVVISILILQILSSVFNIQRLDNNLKTFVFGLILAAVMVMEYWRSANIHFKKKNKKVSAKKE